jgi:UDP-3-O-[3-hydroxymyristoyl] N-acetylglucosamine deacetylase
VIWTRFVDMGSDNGVANRRRSGNNEVRVDDDAPIPRERVVDGIGLHTGSPVRVTLRARRGPVSLSVAGVEASLDRFAVVETARATTIAARDGRIRVSTVEHAFAALGGLGIRSGVVLVIDGPELPLLDGGANEWCRALEALALPRGEPLSRVARAGAVAVGASRYEFYPADRVEVEARLELDHPDVTPEARWTGDAADFRARIAPARTFVLASDVDDLARRGLARHVDPRSVVVIAHDSVHCVGSYSPDEPVRHKILDLVGDAYLHGGPPLGRTRAIRPGHAANRTAFLQAWIDGIIVRV